ncbi:hypothetical protein JZ751_024145 [Albula glossodonta]|uniref:Uncharacterized protein n=1 Tax=Albula glossodonta TaxID=121402 RepID=A0A8T2NGK7_9TELE|nr:hypothetical protein JZ751_024145 [Albula glossodonta]
MGKQGPHSVAEPGSPKPQVSEGSSFVTRREIKRQRQPISCHGRLTEATNRQLHQTELRGGAEETAKLTDTDLQTHRRFCVQ